MTVTGKVQKFKLREQAIEELGLAGGGDGLGVCGRYTLSTVDGPEIAQRFSLITPPAEETLGRFNVCPTETIAAVVEPGEAAAVAVGAAAVPQPLVHADQRALGDGRAALQVADDRRALPRAGRRLVRVAQGGEEGLASGCRSATRSTAARRSRSRALYDGTGAAILTTEANEICAPIHDRMPVVLEGPEAEAAWLSDEVDVDAALELLVPLENARVSVAPANPAVNKAGVEGAELLTPPSDTLF